MLSDKIWITRKARIYSEKRLQRKAILSQIIITWYSFLFISLSIVNLAYKSQKVGILLIVGSIAVVISSILLTSRKFIDRSLAMRNCYIRLDELFAKVKNAEELQDHKLIQQIESEYATLLLNVENHTDYDYFCLRYSLRSNEKTTLPKFTKLDSVIFYCEKFWRFMVIAFCFVWPILIFYLWDLIISYVSIYILQ